MAAAAALASTASAQDDAQDQAAATTPAAPASTTPAPATTPAVPQPQPDGSTDLGTLEVQVPTPPPRTTPKRGDEQRRAGARRFLREERRSGRTPEAPTVDPVADPLDPPSLDGVDGLDSPLAVPPPEGVPNVTLDSFRIPPFLLPIYQAAGVEYGVRWEVLAAINEIETDYGRNLSVSSAGALGWMQFMPGTWKAYGVDANNDGRKDPYNPVDAIFAAARYLNAAGAGDNLREAIWAYNHADWYVNDVLERARTLAALPADVVGALSGLTMGRFPVLGSSDYAGRFTAASATRDQVSVPVTGTAGRKGANVTGEVGAAAIAVQDGRVVRIGQSKRLGRFVKVRDVYGNTYTYGHLGAVAERHAVPRKTALRASTPEVHDHEEDPAPTAPATAGRRGKASTPTSSAADTGTAASSATRPVKERLFAEPMRPRAYHAGGERQVRAVEREAEQTPQEIVPGALRDYLAPPYALRRNQVALLPLKEGSRVIAGTILGRIGEQSDGADPHIRFEIRPAGSGAPRIDPTPILDGWRLLDSTQVFRAQNPMLAGTGGSPTIGQILLMSKEALERRVLANPKIDVYACGRQDIRAGIIDRRVLALLEFLAANDLKPTVTSLRCGHGYYTASGNVSHHSSGDAVDIAAINGTPIIGHQGAGSITDVAVRRLLTLQGTMKPAQIITLMEYAGTDNTLAMGDHDDHIHVGFQPAFGANAASGRRAAAVLRPGQWQRLIGRLGAIQNPTVPLQPSKYAVKVKVKLPAKG
jgi:murein DD-endopeptidase MepM/ murein hydrolase activator NlpD